MILVAIGSRRLRVEDESLLMGSACFVDDIHLEGVVEAAFLRSPIAHGELHDSGVAEIGELPGVVAAFDAEDLGLGPLVPPNDNPSVWPPSQPVLASGKVRFAGEPIAIVLGRDRYAAEDGRDAALPEIEELEAVVDPWRAIDPGAPQIHEGRDNLAVDVIVDEGDVDGAFEAADTIVERTLTTPRLSAMPIEGRAVLAKPEGDGVRLWTSSQLPHKVREAVSGILGLEPQQVRVITPDVGGGFGVKAHVYPEEVVLAAVAMRVGKPVKWIEDRAENLAASTQARKQELRIRAAMSDGGKLLALDVEMLCDQGAYGAYPHGVALEAMTTSGMLPGPYRLANFRVRARTALTNTSPQGAYRGVGFVISTFAHERIIDALAREAGLDPAEVRRRNLIGADELPYVSATKHPYDSGDYGRALDMALEQMDYGAIEEKKRVAAAEGRRFGVGLACYVEPTGMNSKVFEMRGMVGIEGYDAAHMAVDGDGRARLWTTTPAIGQGTTTTMAQVAAAALGIDPGDISVEHSDTGAAELKGTGSFASRSAASAGGAVISVSKALRQRLLDDAAEHLEAAKADLEIADGGVRVTGSPGSAVPIGDLVSAAPERYRLSKTFDPPQTVYPYATHICEIGIDEGTGEVEVERYVVVEDCGRIINPLVVEGQVHGATAQGIGGALYEMHDYDPEGQLRTASLLDYIVPTATEIPAVELLHLEIPTPVTDSGFKGVGEGGTIAPAAAIAGAVSDALGIEFNHFPIRPHEVVAALAGDSQ